MHALLWLLVAACNLPDLSGPPAPDCERSAWYPDEDRDGLGEAGRVYVGCSPPAHWVTNADDPAQETGRQGPDEDSDSAEDSDTTEDSDSEDSSGA